MDLVSFVEGGIIVLLISTASRFYERLLIKIQVNNEPAPVEEAEEKTTMEKIPAKYSLSEDDIKEAIKEWLYNNHNVEASDITVTFHVEHKQEQPNTPYRGGMSDWVDKTIITAVAEEAE